MIDLFNTDAPRITHVYTFPNGMTMTSVISLVIDLQRTAAYYSDSAQFYMQAGRVKDALRYQRLAATAHRDAWFHLSQLLRMRT